MQELLHLEMMVYTRLGLFRTDSTMLRRFEAQAEDLLRTAARHRYDGAFVMNPHRGKKVNHAAFDNTGGSAPATATAFRYIKWTRPSFLVNAAGNTQWRRVDEAEWAHADARPSGRRPMRS